MKHEADVKRGGASGEARLAVWRGVLQLLPMVEWDRVIRDEGGETCAVFGWVSRSDGGRDFVCLEFLWPDDPSACSMVTSSAKWSAEIGRLLGADVHVDCERVVGVFGELGVSGGG